MYRLRPEIIRTAAAAHGDHSIRRIIARTGLPRSVIYRCLGGYTEPSLATVMRLHETYGIPAHDLVTEIADTAQATG